MGTRADAKQTLWVDDVEITLGPAARVRPPAPDAAGASKPILPAQDPPPQGPPVKDLDAVANKHPRLLFTAERIPQLQAFYQSPKGKLYREQIDGYVPGCTIPSDRKLTSAWSQEYGLFKLPMVALHYVVTKDKASPSPGRRGRAAISAVEGPDDNVL